MSETGPYDLPYLDEIFDQLRRGRHLCAADGKLYRALRENLEAFQELFHHLGFRLKVHQRDFFYFRGKDSLSPQASRMAVFVFILIFTAPIAGSVLPKCAMEYQGSVQLLLVNR